MNINSELMQSKALLDRPAPSRALINHMEVSTHVRHCNGQPLGVNIAETERMMLEAFDKALCRTPGFCDGYPRLRHVEAVRGTQQTPARWYQLHYLIGGQLLEFRGFIGPSTMIDLEKRVVCVPELN